MLHAIREQVVIRPGGTIEIRRPELPTGASAEVIVVVEEQPPDAPPLASYIGRGKGCFRDAAEIDAFIRSERDAWQR